MEMEVSAMVERLAAAASALEAAAQRLATLEVQASASREAELGERLQEAEATIASMKASGRKTVSSFVAKDASDGALLDAALTSLSVEQRIAVKAGLMRGGLLG